MKLLYLVNALLWLINALMWAFYAHSAFMGLGCAIAAAGSLLYARQLDNYQF